MSALFHYCFSFISEPIIFRHAPYSVFAWPSMSFPPSFKLLFSEAVQCLISLCWRGMLFCCYWQLLIGVLNEQVYWKEIIQTGSIHLLKNNRVHRNVWIVVGITGIKYTLLDDKWWLYWYYRLNDLLALTLHIQWPLSSINVSRQLPQNELNK